MTQTEKNLTKPKWIKILLGILTAWTVFILIMAVLFVLVWIVQVKLLNFMIEDTSAIILLIVGLIISSYLAFKITKWQDKFLERKPLRTSYIILIILILLALITIPAPMTYLTY